MQHCPLGAMSLFSIYSLCSITCISESDCVRVWCELTFPRHVTDQIPGLDEVWLFALQPDDTLIGLFLKLLIFIEALLRLLRVR